jgi:hypothetical protein
MPSFKVDTNEKIKYEHMCFGGDDPIINTPQDHDIPTVDKGVEASSPTLTDFTSIDPRGLNRIAQPN